MEKNKTKHKTLGAKQKVKKEKAKKVGVIEKTALTTRYVNQFLEEKAPFVIDMTVVDTYQIHEMNQLFADAIKGSKTLKSFFFVYPRATISIDDWNAMTNALSENQSITELGFNNKGPKIDAEKMLVDVLTRNKRIKKLGFTYHSKNTMKYLKHTVGKGSSIEHLDILQWTQAESTDQEDLFNALKENTSITTLSLKQQGLGYSSDLLNSILKALVFNTTVHTFIVDLGISSASNEEISLFKELLQKTNSLKTIDLYDRRSVVKYLPIITEGLKTNKSVAKLVLDISIEQEDYALLGDVLMVNNTLTSLDMKNTEISYSRLADFARGLAHNSGLKSLNIRNKYRRRANESTDGLDALENALLQNNTLTKLDIRNAPAKDFEKLLTHNNTLQTLKLCVDTPDIQWLLRSLTKNQSLTKLGMVKSPGFSQDFFESMTSCLEFNHSLLYLEATSVWDLGGTMAQTFDPEAWTKILDRNRANMKKRKSEILLVLRTILKQPGFTERLPLDLWAKILSELKFPGITADLGQVLYSLSQRPNAKVLF